MVGGETQTRMTRNKIIFGQYFCNLDNFKLQNLTNTITLTIINTDMSGKWSVRQTNTHELF